MRNKNVNSTKIVIISTALLLILMPTTIIIHQQVQAATPTEAWNAGYDDAYNWLYNGHVKPQKSHTQAYFDGFDAGMAARNSNNNSPRQAQAQTQESNQATVNNNKNEVTINNILPNTNGGKENGGSSITMPDLMSSNHVITVTFVDSKDRDFNDIQLFIKEQPQIAVPPSKGSTNLNEAFWPDGEPYTPQFSETVNYPDDLIGEGQEFHLCMKEISHDGHPDNIVACYKMTDTMRNSLTINTGAL